MDGRARHGAALMAPFEELLACPVCRRALERVDQTLRCDAGHAFDVARQGYVNLLSGRAHTGTADTAAMVAAREAFLATGHYAPLATTIAHAVARATDAIEGCIIDVGAGTGWYLAEVLRAAPGRTGLALDISKHAARRAARAHPDIGAVVCDAWGGLPVRDGVAAAVLDIFAPRNAAEFERVLVPGGVVVVVTPTPAHLNEIVGALGMVSVDPRKDERLETALGERFTRSAPEIVERIVSLTHADALAAVLMGPSAHHLGADELNARVCALPERMTATLSTTIGIWRRAER